MNGSAIGSAGNVAAWATIQTFTPVTIRPPMEANAWVQPSAFSRCFLSGNSSASQVIAATNSTQTPTKVAERKKTNCSIVVLSAAAAGDSE